MPNSRRTDFVVRKAAIRDALELTTFAETAFRDTYSHANDEANMESYIADNFSSARLTSELLNPACRYFVAVNDVDRIIGYAKLKSGDPEPCVSPPAIELERIYVAQTAKGIGIGSVLLETCIRSAVALGYPTLWLGVWGENQDAITFYRKHGFDVVGTHEFVLGDEVQTDLVMGMSLEGYRGQNKTTLPQ